jgi:hypothetical protein
LDLAFSGQTRELVFDPIVADMQIEYATACARGRRLRAAWIRARGHAHLLEALTLVIALGALQAACCGLRRFGAATIVAALLTFALFFGFATLTQSDAALRETQPFITGCGATAQTRPAPQSDYIRVQTEGVR